VTITVKMQITVYSSSSVLQKLNIRWLESCYFTI